MQFSQYSHMYRHNNVQLFFEIKYKNLSRYVLKQKQSTFFLATLKYREKIDNEVLTSRNTGPSFHLLKVSNTAKKPTAILYYNFQLYAQFS